MRAVPSHGTFPMGFQWNPILMDRPENTFKRSHFEVKFPSDLAQGA